MTGLTHDNTHLSEPTCVVSEADRGSPASAVEVFRAGERSGREAAEKIRRLIHASITPNTRRAYRSDLAHFLANGGALPATANDVARYLALYAEQFTTATLERRLVAIGRAHVAQECTNPCQAELVRLTLRGIRRTYGRPQRRALALTKEQLTTIVSSLGDSLRDCRDRALLLIGFYGAFRRSELCLIDCRSITRSKEGILITIRKSKTDQEKKGRDVAIRREEGALCPVSAVEAWLEVSEIADGPIFRPIDRVARISGSTLSGDAVSIILKKRIKAAGYESSNYSGHSLRAGFVTAAVNAGVPTWRIRQQTGHTTDMMLDRYIRQAEAFSDPWRI